MFTWNIAKSLDELFSRWAVKRVCKFLLKKKLGQFILGDIDIEQLDVQLRAGTIQLSDLAINVDFINQKIGCETALTVKEGSIGSLLVQMPWKGKGCLVEIDELEIVVAPRVGDNSLARGESSISRKTGKHCTKSGLGNPGHDVVENAALSTVDIHEGVKTIAKMVQWLLTSFQVNVKKLIIVFDPCSVKAEDKVGSHSILVLRISEIECGTCVSEVANANSDGRVDSFLGISRLKNFVKFQGALLELLQIENVDNKSYSSCSSKTTKEELDSGCCLLNGRTSIITGEKGGVSGALTLSIPWKNGSLDVRKVDVDVSIHPMKIKFQPSTLNWFLLLWESMKNLDNDRRAHVDHKEENSVYYNSESHFHSFSLGSDAISTDKVTPGAKNFYTGFYSGTRQDPVTEGVLPGSHLISDWVPSSINKDHPDGSDEVDFGASMDQFFECFDDMRMSQSALSSSGLLHWTCSVFGAITAASNLASGSLYVPPEQQHVETNLKATVAGISLSLSFHDEGQNICDPKDGLDDMGPGRHFLITEFRSILLVLQVCGQDMKFDLNAENIELDDYANNGGSDRHCTFCAFSNHICSETHLVQHLQSEVEVSLPPFASSTGKPALKKSRASIPFIMSSMDSSTSTSKDDLEKVRLLRTSGVCHCQISVKSKSDGSLLGSTSISLELPPFIFWVNFHLVSMLSDLLKQLKSQRGGPSEGSNEKHRTPDENRTSGSQQCVSSSQSKATLYVNIFIPNARVILCFPFKSMRDFDVYSSSDKFISLDFFSSSTMRKEKVQDTDSISPRRKMHSPETMLSLNIDLGNLDILLVTLVCNDDFSINSQATQRQKFCSHNILSAKNSRTGSSVIHMLWQEGSVTGPWITKMVKFLATSGNSDSTDDLTGQGYEFASATTSKNLEDFSSHTRKEIILSSPLFLHVHMSPVTLNLSSSQYKEVHNLLNQVINELASDTASVREESSVSQTSILVECDSVEISIILDKMECIKSSMLTELPGSWCNFKLKILKFELLSVSDIGGISGSSFLRLAHGEGNLWGSITEVPDEDFLLISCSNSSMKRGNGEGSNALSSWAAGSDIIHFRDPETFHNFTSITVRCCTLVAVGGRLDWLDSLSSFFSLSSESEHVGENRLQNVNSRMSSGASFALNLVDIGLSYEPYLKCFVDVVPTCSSNVNKYIGEQYVSCLLAASSLNLSNITVDSSIDNDYKIRVQDLGLLLCAVSGPEIARNTYSAEHLHNMGYIKVAGEALVEANIRTNCRNGLLWEVECSESHIHLDTCSDTFSGVIRLASQLQQLFAPDLEETFVHLQTRWQNAQQAQEMNHFFEEGVIFKNEAVASQVSTLNPDRSNKPGEVGLMDEICEDAFHFGSNQTWQHDSCESQLQVPVVRSLFDEACDRKVKSETVPQEIHFNLSVPVIALEDSKTVFRQKDCFPEFIEDYCVSEFLPVSDLSVGNQSSNQTYRSKSRNVVDGDLQRRNCGWYGDTSLRIVENHISNVSKGLCTIQSREHEISFNHRASLSDSGNTKGRVLLKNINVRWRMFAGSDWQETQKLGKQSKHGRDTAVCLELALSGVDFKCDVFGDREVLVSKLSLSVQDLNFYDNSRDAPWKMVLGYYHSKDHPRESSSKALKFDLEAVRPDPLTPLEEYRVCIAFSPLLLHLHQSQLDFLISYFGGESSSNGQTPGCTSDSGRAETAPVRNSTFGGQSIAEEAFLPYIQKLDIWPFLVRVDYTPRRVDLTALRGGKYVELVNLVPWKGVELQLKHVAAMGVYGWSNVCETILGEWLEDVSQNQIHKLLQGLPTIRSMVSISSGAAKLVSLPLENYRKDHRLLKGMQRGTIAFLRSISLEAVGLGVHLAAGAHDILFQAECILSNPPSLPLPLHIRNSSNIRSNQPNDAQQGIHQAYESLGDGLGKSANALLRTPFISYQRGAGAGSALATAVRATPLAAIAPASAAARALHCAFVGVRNSLDPDHKKESMEKYQGPSQSREHT